MIKKSWSLLPKKIRQLIVFVVGSTLIVAGVALIILPGPFTMPLVIAGLFILAIEFAWAETLLSRAKDQTKKVVARKKPKA